jgi:SnoaL-like domain
MSRSPADPLTRHLDEIFGESDSGRRRTAVDALLTEDCVFYAPTGAYRGRDEIHRVAGKVRSMHPDFRYRPIEQPERLLDGGRIRWVAGPLDGRAVYAGTNFLVIRDGRIAAIYKFFDALP